MHNGSPRCRGAESETNGIELSGVESRAEDRVRRKSLTTDDAPRGRVILERTGDERRLDVN